MANNVNMIIINGKVVGGKKMGSAVDIDETKKIDKNAQSIIVDSKFADVKFSVSDGKSIVIRLHGKCSFEGSAPSLDVIETNKQIKIGVKYLGNGFLGKLCMDVGVPNNLYDLLNISSLSGDILIENLIKSKKIKIETLSGDVDVSSECEDVSVETMSGDIDFEFKAIKNSRLNIESMSGDIAVKFLKVSAMNVSATTMTGKLKNSFKSSLDGGYNVNVFANTMSGDIKLK